MEKIKCGDANPGGNVVFTYKGGCGEDVNIKEAYRCVGCGGFFHLSCIHNHFQLEEGHDDARNALRKIKDYALSKHAGMSLDKKLVLKMADYGLDKKLDKKRLKI